MTLDRHALWIAARYRMLGIAHHFPRVFASFRGKLGQIYGPSRPALALLTLPAPPARLSLPPPPPPLPPSSNTRSARGALLSRLATSQSPAARRPAAEIPAPAKPGPAKAKETLYSLLVAVMEVLRINGEKQKLGFLASHSTVRDQAALRHMGSLKRLVEAFPSHLQRKGKSISLMTKVPPEDTITSSTILGRVTQLVLDLDSLPGRKTAKMPDTSVLGTAKQISVQYPALFKLDPGSGALALCVPAADLEPLHLVLSGKAPAATTAPAPNPAPTPAPTPAPAVLTKASPPPAPPRTAPSISSTLQLASIRTPTTSPPHWASLSDPYYHVPSRAVGWRIATAQEALNAFMHLTEHATKIALDVDGPPDHSIDTAQLAYIPTVPGVPAIPHVFVWEFGAMSKPSDRRALKGLLAELLQASDGTCKSVVMHDPREDEKRLHKTLGVTLGPNIINTQAIASKWEQMSAEAWDKMRDDGIPTILADPEMRDQAPWDLFRMIAPSVLKQHPDSHPSLNCILYAAGRPMNRRKDLPAGLSRGTRLSLSPGYDGTDSDMVRFELRLQDVDQLIQALKVMNHNIEHLHNYLIQKK
ncbi:hypothetical protein BC828DRAFT_393633 [Blastocladiella britannica]|nr:hypothetical protein BC828DRAFT_393633 [Blastocladiella britannica]